MNLIKAAILHALIFLRELRQQDIESQRIRIQRQQTRLSRAFFKAQKEAELNYEITKRLRSRLYCLRKLKSCRQA